GPASRPKCVCYSADARRATIGCTSTGGASVTADSVEREILIEASPEVVWGVITEPEQIRRWFSDEADVDARAGADGSLTWKPGGRGGEKEFDSIVPIRVVEAEPFRRFSFRW